MNIWLVTTGSSDVQLTCDEHWNDWCQDIKKSLHRLPFEPVRAIQDEGEPYRLPARVLGIAYDKLPNEVLSHLAFPLLKGFTRRLKEQGTQIDRIVILMSDQENIFSEAERETTRCPYWQDTCQLYPILEGYFQEHFSEATLTPLMLKPDSLEQGLDDWDAVLSLVRREVSSLDLEPGTVYVSHQAGTPAISSAVQFASLAKFGDRVQFLVSSEYDSDRTRTIASSKYLSAIRVQEAKALLDRYDYAGVKEILGIDFTKATTKQEKDIAILLEAAIQWNFAKFDQFADELKRHQKFIAEVEERTKQENWWWIGYESAYLAIIRHRQGNIVDALFHSFRSVEGLICIWAETTYKDCIVYDKKGSPQITERIKEILPEYWKKIEEKQHKWLTEQREKKQQSTDKGQEQLPLSTGLFSQSLYMLLEMARPESKKNKYIKTVLYSAKDERNQQFHRLLGLQEENLFQAWKANNVREWNAVLLGCLNFLAQVDLTSNFESVESASLMAKVHQELRDAIATHELQS